MKKSISICNEARKNGDVFTSYDFDFYALVKRAWNDLQRLSDYDRKQVGSVVVTAYSVTVPDDYTVATAEQLVGDAIYGGVDVPEFDALLGSFADSSITRQVSLTISFSRAIKANLPSSGAQFVDGQGEGVWVRVGDDAKRSYNRNDHGAEFFAILDNDPLEVDLEAGDVVLIELRGDKRPVIIPDYLSEDSE